MKIICLTCEEQLFTEPRKRTEFNAVQINNGGMKPAQIMSVWMSYVISAKSTYINKSKFFVQFSSICNLVQCILRTFTPQCVRI